MPMEVATEDDRRTDEPSALDIPVRVRLSSPTHEPRVYNQRADIQGLLRLRRRILIAGRSCVESGLAFPITPTCLSDSDQPISLNCSHVSYLAQTLHAAPVIVYSPECVERVTTASS